MQILEGAQVMKSLMPIFPPLNKGVANVVGMLHEVKEKMVSWKLIYIFVEVSDRF
jgi:ACT domain-containing protein